MLLIARYDCFVDDQPTNKVDYQVKYYELTPDVNIERLLQNEPVDSYEGAEGNLVEWRFNEICAIEWEPKLENGSEVIGFITGKPVSVED